MRLQTIIESDPGGADAGLVERREILGLTPPWRWRVLPPGLFNLAQQRVLPTECLGQELPAIAPAGKRYTGHARRCTPIEGMDLRHDYSSGIRGILRIRTQMIDAHDRIGGA